MLTLFAIGFLLFWGTIIVFGAAALIVAGIIGAVLGLFKQGRAGVSVQKSDHTETRRIKNKKKQRGFTDEEILGLGLYPDDEGYRMSLISKIRDKNRKR